MAGHSCRFSRSNQNSQFARAAIVVLVLELKAHNYRIVNYLQTKIVTSIDRDKLSGTSACRIAIEPDTETIAVYNAKGFGLLESSGDDCIGAVTLSVDRLRVPKEGLRRLHGRARKDF